MRTCVALFVARDDRSVFETDRQNEFPARIHRVQLRVGVFVRLPRFHGPEIGVLAALFVALTPPATAQTAPRLSGDDYAEILQLYFKDGKAKIEVAVAKGKKAHDKRSTLMEQQATREVNRELSRRQSGKDSF